MTLYLIGPPFSGKSTIGKLLADKMNFPFLDSDRLLEAKFNKSVRALFKEVGETTFREEETKIIENIKEGVVACGGGALFQKKGKAVFLDTPADLLWRRVNIDNPPVYLNPNDLEKSFKDLVISRRKRYLSQADVVIDMSRLNPDDAVSEIIIEALNGK